MSTKKGSKAREQAESNGQAKFPAMGYTAWWTISSLEQTQAQLEAALDASIGRNFMPDTPGMQRASRLALEAIESAGIITRIPTGTEDTVAYTLHRKDVDKKAIDLNLEKEQTIVYHKTAKTVEIRSKFHRDEIAKLITKYETIFTEEDVRRIVLRWLKAAGATTMRDTGAIYFIDADMRTKIRTFIEMTGGKFYSLGVYDIDTDKATMHEIVKDELDHDLQIATEDVKQFLLKTQEDGDNTRLGAFETKLGVFKSIRAKAELYRDLLETDVEQLKKMIETVSTEVRAALSGEVNEYPQAKQFPYKARVKYSGKGVEKNGEDATVVGYESTNDVYVKVLFDKTNKIVAVNSKSLKLVDEKKKSAA